MSNALLYLIATPIGNLADITQRALQVLADCDAILCEDTRRSSILLQKYNLKKTLLSYHQFKEQKLLIPLLDRLKSGEKLALISDAGTPCINDPGLILVQACIEHQIPFTVLPGPCSVIQALLLSGFETKQFQFIGFLPKKPEKVLRAVLGYPGTTVCFESPERLVASLKILEKLDERRSVGVAREMTKTFEECVRGVPTSLRLHFEQEVPRGEIALILAEGEMPEDLSSQELVALLQQYQGLSLRDAVKMASKLQKIPKRAIYKETLKN